MAGDFGIGTTWAAGDTNYDGVINLGDLDLLMANFGQSVPSGSGSDSSIATVPEPGTFALLAAGLLGLLAYAWKKRSSLKEYKSQGACLHAPYLMFTKEAKSSIQGIGSSLRGVLVFLV